MSVIDQLKAGVELSGSDAMEAFGQTIGEHVPKDWTIRLLGDLGVGKTTLVRGIAKGLGIQDAVTSPTYALYNVYQGKTQLLHLDAYRLQSEEDLEALAIDEFLASPYCMIIEWPTNIGDTYYGDGYWELELSIVEPGKHSIRLVRSA